METPGSQHTSETFSTLVSIHTLQSHASLQCYMVLVLTLPHSA